MNSKEGHVQCTKPTKRRGPSAENQRQIDHAIAARSLKISAYSGASVSINLSDHDTCARRDEPGTAPPNAQYEYLNHPADILLHAWGGDFISSLRNLAYAMFGCITSLSSVSTDAHHSEEFGQNITAQGHDTRSLVYAFLDEWLFNFHETGFIPNNIEIIDYDPHTHRISCKGNGEVLDLSRHPRGMEVKAITYSAMRVEEVNGRCDVYVVVDI